MSLIGGARLEIEGSAEECDLSKRLRGDFWKTRRW
jgi:hypothetical protein